MSNWSWITQDASYTCMTVASFPMSCNTDGFAKSRIQSMCHSRLPTPETIFSLCASISGYGGQVDRREKSYVFSKLYCTDFSLAQTGFFSPANSPGSVAPLAQTGMTGKNINSKVVAPGRAGQA